MLENLLQQLIEALNNNTAALTGAKVQTPSKVAENDEPAEEPAEESKPAKKSRAKAKKEPVVTLEQVKELSGELADSGAITVKETRAKINALGYNLMKEMSDEDLAELYNWLLGVKAEAEANEEEEEEEDL